MDIVRRLAFTFRAWVRLTNIFYGENRIKMILRRQSTLLSIRNNEKR
jgi:hypothetical protein